MCSVFAWVVCFEGFIWLAEQEALGFSWCEFEALQASQVPHLHEARRLLRLLHFQGHCCRDLNFRAGGDIRCEEQSRAAVSQQS